MALQNKSTADAARNYFNYVTPNGTCITCTLTCNYCAEVFSGFEQYAKIFLNDSLLQCSINPYSETTQPYRFFAGDTLRTACGSIMFGYFFD